MQLYVFCFLTIISLHFPSGALVRLLNSTGQGDEGDAINVCTELVSIEGGVRRPLSVAIMILSGTADCKRDNIKP